MCLNKTLFIKTDSWLGASGSSLLRTLHSSEWIFNLPFSVGPSHQGVNSLQTKTLTPTFQPRRCLSTTPPLAGHIYWKSLCFLTSHSRPTAFQLCHGNWSLGGYHWPPCCEIQWPLISPYLTQPLGNIWLLTTPTSWLSCHTPRASLRPGVGVGTPPQTSLLASLLCLLHKSWCSQDSVRVLSSIDACLWVSSSLLGFNAHWWLSNLCLQPTHPSWALDLKPQLLLDRFLDVSKASQIHHVPNSTHYLSPPTWSVPGVQRMVLLSKQTRDLFMTSFYLSLPPSVDQSNPDSFPSTSQLPLQLCLPLSIPTLVPATSISHLGSWELLLLACTHLAPPVRPSYWSWRSSSNIPMCIPYCSLRHATALRLKSKRLIKRLVLLDLSQPATFPQPSSPFVVQSHWISSLQLLRLTVPLLPLDLCTCHLLRLGHS